MPSDFPPTKDGATYAPSKPQSARGARGGGTRTSVGLTNTPAASRRLAAGPQEPRDTLATARRHPALLIACALIVALIAVALSVLRSPVYKAESRLLVGDSQSVDPQNLQSLGVATGQLAATYSRLISSDQVLAEVDQRAGLQPTEARSVLTASPIPETAVIRIEATASSSVRARQIADAGATGLRDFVVNDSTATTAALQNFERAATDYNALVQQRDVRKAALSRLVASVANTPTADEQTQIDDARAQLADLEGQVATANLKVNTLQDAYTTSQRGGDGTDVVRIVQTAQSTGNDRMAQAERNGLLGVVLGLLLGLALALASDRRRA